MQSCGCNNSIEEKEKKIENFSLDKPKYVCHLSCAHMTWTNITLCVLVIVLIWYIVNNRK